MVGYVKQNFFVRYRSFESWVHLNQLAEKWSQEEADARMGEAYVNQADFVLIKPISFVQLRDLTSRLKPKNQ